MPVRTIQSVRYIDSHALNLRLDVYDDDDLFVKSYPMNEIINEIYKADVTLTSSDLWGIVIDNDSGNKLTMIRVSPSTQIINQYVDETHLVTSSDMSIDSANGNLIVTRGDRSISFELKSENGTKAASPATAKGRVRV